MAKLADLKAAQDIIDGEVDDLDEAEWYPTDDDGEPDYQQHLTDALAHMERLTWWLDQTINGTTSLLVTQKREADKALRDALQFIDGFEDSGDDAWEED